MAEHAILAALVWAAGALVSAALLGEMIPCRSRSRRLTDRIAFEIREGAPGEAMFALAVAITIPAWPIAGPLWTLWSAARLVLGPPIAIGCAVRDRARVEMERRAERRALQMQESQGQLALARDYGWLAIADDNDRNEG